MMKKIFLIFIIIFTVSEVSAEPAKEFVMSCIYGTLAGTIIGAASLATVDNPSDNLQRIARGASLGLYAGILLGAYVVYAVPDEDEQLNDVLSPEASFFPRVYPMLTNDLKIHGVSLNFTVANF